MASAEAPQWTMYAKERLASEGYRRGGGRAAVIEWLDTQACALTAQQIEDGLKATQRRVARATVYRVLDELVELGLLSKVEIGDGVSRFETAFPEGVEHHHHLVCTNCGRLVPFTDDDLERAIRRMVRREGFEMQAHEVTVRGVCPNCT